jgi:hypothetical protein
MVIMGIVEARQHARFVFRTHICDLLNRSLHFIHLLGCEFRLSRVYVNVGVQEASGRVHGGIVHLAKRLQPAKWSLGLLLLSLPLALPVQTLVFSILSILLRPWIW